MPTRHRFHAAISALALASTLTACASTSGTRVAKASDFRNKSVDLGLATRAVGALNSENFPLAIQYAEKAVAQTPRDAGFRMLLGNAYFGAGRFASAEQAFKDALSLYPDQPGIMLKLALVQIAQGKTDEALAFLDFAKNALDPADYGLAIALAGRANDAIPVLRQAAGGPTATPRVRQNLALAYALAGDWVDARVVASQDVSPTQIDERIQQWMQFAGGSAKPATQVAALVGVTPVAFDPGQPVQLALVKTDTRTAQAAPAPVAAPAPAPVTAAAQPPQPQVQPAPDVVAYVPPPPMPVVEEPAPAPTPIAFVAPAQQQPQVGSLTVKLPEARPAPEAAPAIASAAPTYVPPKEFPYVEVKKRGKAKTVIAAAPKPRAPVKNGKSSAVVQLGAYGSPQAVSAAWARLTKTYPALRAHLPMRARFVSPKGTFWRLSITGFENQGEAKARCALLQSHGGNCFVRTVAGDRPVQIASR